MRNTGLIAVLLVPVLAGSAKGEREFFAFDNGLTRIETPKEKVAVLKELGYAGIGSRSGEIAGLLPELDAAGLRMVSSYVGIEISADAAQYDARLPGEIELLRGRGTYLWLTIRGDREKDLDDLAVQTLREVADMAQEAGLPISLYPHAGFYVATALDALRIARKADRPNVGASFNLCHFLMQNDVDEIENVVRKVAPLMNLVSINGADHGSNLPLDRALQRLDKGDFDNAKLLKLLDDAGYEGSVGLQCYAIEGDCTENLAASMGAWKNLNSRGKQKGDSE